ncbi:MAG: thiazole synthase [Nitrospinae bacterium]|nr:thiazole synthase [Nitrospinota bacterium]
MWKIAGAELKSRVLLGTARYPSPEVMQKAIEASAAGIVTVSLRRHGPRPGAQNVFWDILRQLPVRLLPNTAGCHSVKEAVTTAHMARELFNTNWIKLEVIGDDYNLQPDPFGLVEAAKILADDGFEVFPYMTDDLVLAERLLSAGCKILMPWAAPIGSGQGIVNPLALKTIRQRFPEIPVIIDAGLGKPSHAAQAMEMGFDGVLLNTAVAQAEDPVKMARAFAQAVEAGRAGFEAGMMPQRDFATPSTPVVGTPFWHENK